MGRSLQEVKMIKRLKKWVLRHSPMTPEERRHAHKMILLSSAGGCSLKGDGQGNLDIGVIKAVPDCNSLKEEL
jgi:hypothetical protein